MLTLTSLLQLCCCRRLAVVWAAENLRKAPTMVVSSKSHCLKSLFISLMSPKNGSLHPLLRIQRLRRLNYDSTDARVKYLKRLAF